jgi:hypothetical protein
MVTANCGQAVITIQMTPGTEPRPLWNRWFPLLAGNLAVPI